MKEIAADLWDCWDYRDRDSTRPAWYRLLGWMARSWLQPMVQLGQTVRNQLAGILNALDFHLGGLDLYPAKVSLTS